MGKSCEEDMWMANEHLKRYLISLYEFALKKYKLSHIGISLYIY